MKTSNIEIIYVAIACALLIFGYWGVHTVSGRKIFDEMAGMIPLLLGIVLGSIMLVLWLGYRIYRLV